MSTHGTDPSAIGALDGIDPERRALIERLMRARQAARPEATPTSTPGTGTGTGEMKISLFFFSADEDDDPWDKHELVLECAELADGLGLHAVWVPERHFDPFGAPYPSPGLLLAAIAARTERIGLRAGSVVLPLRDPLLVAEEWGVLDSLSRGRTGISLASGWHADDFVLNPDGYETRKQAVEERLNALYQLWRGGSIKRQAPAGRLIEVPAYPRPRQVPEAWLTSTGNPQTWRTAADLDLHVLTALLEQSLDEVAEKIGIYREELTAAGRSFEAHEVTCMLHTHLAADAQVARERVREPLKRYLTAHLKLFEKFAASQSQRLGIRPEDVTEADRRALIDHGLRRYIDTAGLFGTAESCLPMIGRLRAAGITELGCLVDFGLPREQVVESVRELARLNDLLRAQVPASADRPGGRA